MKKIKTLKGYTDEQAKRHYYPDHEEWQLVEATSEVIKLDMTGQAELLLTRPEARDLSRLLDHFAEHGTIPPPRRQEASPVCR